MGQFFNKGTSGGNNSGEKKEQIMKARYEAILKDKDCSLSDFYRAICDTVEELNEKQGYTQVKTIDKNTLQTKYDKYRQGKGKPTYEEFMKMVADLEQDLKLTGIGVKDTLLYIFGVPASATFIKNALMPSLVSNEVLIPSMTSLTVLVLAKLNKI